MNQTNETLSDIEMNQFNQTNETVNDIEMNQTNCPLPDLNPASTSINLSAEGQVSATLNGITTGQNSNEMNHTNASLTAPIVLNTNDPNYVKTETNGTLSIPRSTFPTTATTLSFKPPTLPTNMRSTLPEQCIQKPQKPLR
eukprot:670770_1